MAYDPRRRHPRVQFGRLVDDGVHAETLKAITGAWIKRSGIAVDRPLLFAIRHELSAGRSLADRIIRSGASNQSMYYALLCLAKLNSPEDLPLVESVINSNAVLWPPRGQTVQMMLPGRKLPGRLIAGSFSVQTRDVALAVAIHLRGRKPTEFGIPVIPSDETVFVVYSMGFETQEDRDRSLSSYRAEFPDSPSKDQE